MLQLMVVIGNHNSNQFWEKYYKGEKLTSNVEKEIREEFLRAKYLTRSWIPSSEGHTKDSLNQQLCKNVSTPNILRTIELLALGADVSGGGVVERGERRNREQGGRASL